MQRAARRWLLEQGLIVQGETRKEHLSRLDTFAGSWPTCHDQTRSSGRAISWQTSGPGFRCRHRTSNLQWAR